MTHLLAEGSNIWVGAMFAVLWFVGMIVSTLAKQKKERQERDTLIQRTRSVPTIPPLRSIAPTPPVTARPPATRKQPLQRPAKKARAQVFVDRLSGMTDRAAPRTAPGVTPRVTPTATPRAIQPVAPATPPVATQRPNADADELRLALKPRHAKLQFVLAELIRPPLALREERGDR